MTTQAYNEPNKQLLLRYEKTLRFIERIELESNLSVLDLGTTNPLTDMLVKKGFQVRNSGLVDLDLNPEVLLEYDTQVVTAFEILEHLVSPFTVLRSISAEKLIATVPLKLWFAKAYRHPTDEWDRHFHEFEDWQFDWLLKKSGWRILYKEKWIAPAGKIGFRPMLRKITPRFYAVYAERIK